MVAQLCVFFACLLMFANFALADTQNSNTVIDNTSANSGSFVNQSVNNLNLSPGLAQLPRYSVSGESVTCTSAYWQGALGGSKAYLDGGRDASNISDGSTALGAQLTYVSPITDGSCERQAKFLVQEAKRKAIFNTSVGCIRLFDMIGKDFPMAERGRVVVRVIKASEEQLRSSCLKIAQAYYQQDSVEFVNWDPRKKYHAEDTPVAPKKVAVIKTKRVANGWADHTLKVNTVRHCGTCTAGDGKSLKEITVEHLLSVGVAAEDIKVSPSDKDGFLYWDISLRNGNTIMPLGKALQLQRKYVKLGIKTKIVGTPGSRKYKTVKYTVYQ